MLKKFQMWFYLKLLEYKFKKDGKWAINLDFLYSVVSGFKDEWLINYNQSKAIEEIIVIHFKTIEDLLLAIKQFIKTIEANEALKINFSSFETFAKEVGFINYLTSKEKLPIDPYKLQKELKKDVLDTIAKLKVCEEKEKLQFGYYQRNSERLVSDVLELYWCFISISKQ